MKYSIYRAGAVFVTVEPTGKQTKKIMDVNYVDLSFTLNNECGITIGDYFTVYGETYVIKEEPDCNKVSSFQFDYTVQGKGKAYDAIDCLILFPDSTNTLTIRQFSVMGNASIIVDLILRNLNRVNNIWIKGTIDATETKNFTFSGDNCLSALSTVAQTFDIEWWIVGTTIHMTKKGVYQPITLKYGKNNGLYNITRSKNKTDIVTRLYVYGSSDNIPASYRNYSPELLLPSPLLYLEKNVSKYGIIEQSYQFPDIKPKYIGTITSVSDIFHFIDTSIDFNINDQQLVSVKPQVEFLTGQLAGYTFEVGSFNNTTKEVRILYNQDEKALTLPNSLLKPAIGDKITFVNISMPTVYITDAEIRLQTSGQDYLDKNSDPSVVYGVTADPLNFKKRNITINLGDYIVMQDDDFQLNENIRITQFTRDIQQEWTYTFDLQQVVQISQLIKNYDVYQDIKNAADITKLTDPNKARMSWKTTQQLRSMIYDPDGDYFDPGNIKPESIETLMLSVGAKAQQFLLNGVLIEANYNADENSIHYSNGFLTHFTLFPDAYTWEFTAATITGLNPANSYYIYAKCSKTTTAGTIIFNTTPLKTEEIAGYYVFWIGVLHSVIDGVRGISLTYGQTTINGRFITTGRVQSQDGSTYFDLDDAIIAGKIQFGNNGGSTIVDGNLVTTSTLILGDASGNNVILTGVLDLSSPSDTVIFAIGEDLAHKEDAPFRVTANGHVVMTQADVSGTINATSGFIGDFNILSGILSMNKTHDGGVTYNSVLFGDNVLSSVAPQLKALGRLQIDTPNIGTGGDGENYALLLSATGANYRNYALKVLNGEIDFGNGQITSRGHISLPFLNVIYKGHSGDDRYMKFSNGMLYEEGSGVGGSE